MVKSTLLKLKLTTALVFQSLFVFCQNNITPNWILYSIVGILILIGVNGLISALANIADYESSKNGLKSEEKKGILSFVIDSFDNHKESKNIHKLQKGFDIKLSGKIENNVVVDKFTSRVALKPQSYNGISPIPKVEIVPGNNVKAGEAIFYDKQRPHISYTAPVSGEVLDIKRGEKRSITEIIILADKQQQYIDFTIPSLSSREDVVDLLCKSGAWTMINERPFDIVPDTETVPENIFISTFDTAPLAPQGEILLDGKREAFQKGIDVLAVLTKGKVILGLESKENNVFNNFINCDVHHFCGAHPAGNVGIQIHHIAPIKGNKKVWTMQVQEVIALGNLFLTGRLDRTQIVAVVGSEIMTPQYVRTHQGANVGELVQGNLKGENLRYISGDVLSGEQVELEGFMEAKADQITVIKEGNEYEMFGWLLPLSARPSISGTFPNKIFPDIEFDVNTNTHGEKRAFVVTGQYEEVLPMDIYPQHLFKAIINKDVELMEGLGINELTEEDVALCEFVCTSKQPLQSLLREGLELMKEEA